MSDPSGNPPGGDKNDEKKKKNPAPAPRSAKRRKKKGPSAAVKIPQVFPNSKCKLRLLKLERIKDFLLMEEEYISNQELLRPREEKMESERAKVDDLRGTPMSVGTLEEIIDDNHAIVSSSMGPEYYVSIMSFVNQDLLEPGSAVLLHNKQMSVVGILADDVDPMVTVMKVEKAPSESYADIGGLHDQIQEIKEAVELPLTHPELYEEIGIKPPKGVILYGEPGTGKTLLAKAVANQTSATFLRVVGSELIQKYLGDGPKLVREMFRVADDLSPSIVFIDEIDAVGSKRYESSSGGTKEIQRTMLELLNQLDGFDERGEVKVIMATNRIESLDPALIRPGRIDRKIEFPLPDIGTKRRIFQIHTSKMSLSDDVDVEVFVMAKDDLSGADIKAVCTEAGLLALRERRMRVTQEDFVKAKEKTLYRKRGNIPEGLYLCLYHSTLCVRIIRGPMQWVDLNSSSSKATSTALLVVPEKCTKIRSLTIKWDKTKLSRRAIIITVLEDYLKESLANLRLVNCSRGMEQLPDILMRRGKWLQDVLLSSAHADFTSTLGAMIQHCSSLRKVKIFAETSCSDFQAAERDPSLTELVLYSAYSFVQVAVICRYFPKLVLLDMYYGKHTAVLSAEILTMLQVCPCMKKWLLRINAGSVKAIDKDLAAVTQLQLTALETLGLHCKEIDKKFLEFLALLLGKYPHLQTYSYLYEQKKIKKNILDASLSEVLEWKCSMLRKLEVVMMGLKSIVPEQVEQLLSALSRPVLYEFKLSPDVPEYKNVRRVTS